MIEMTEDDILAALQPLEDPRKKRVEPASFH